MALELLVFVFQFIFFSFLITLPFFYDLNAKFRYYFKFFIFYALIAFASVVLLPLAGWKLLGGAKIVLESKLCRFIAKVLNTSWRVTGLENLKLHKPCVIVANQQNSIDIIGIFEIWPHLHESVIIAENKVYSSPFSLAWSLNFFFDKLFNYKLRTSPKTKELFSKNDNIWIFSKEMYALKNDIFHPLKEHIPVVPVIISNYYFIDTRCKAFEPGNVTVELLPPISNKNGSIDDVSTIIKEIEMTVEKAFTSLSSKITPMTLKELRNCYVF